MAENLSKAMKNFHSKLGLPSLGLQPLHPPTPCSLWSLAWPGRRPKGANIEHILVWHAIITESRRNCESNAKCVSKFKHWKRERKTGNYSLQLRGRWEEGKREGAAKREEEACSIGGGGDSTHVLCELWPRRANNCKITTQSQLSNLWHPLPPFLSSYSPTFLPTASLSRIATLFRPQLQTHNTVDHKSYKRLIQFKLFIYYFVLMRGNFVKI